MYAAQQDLLVERLNLLIGTLHPLLRADVLCALEEKGKLLFRPHIDAISVSSPNNPQPPALPAGAWPLLTLLVAQHITPDIDPVFASSVAVAVECYVCALDLLDDVEDDDQTPVVKTLGPARTLNVSTTLLMLTQRAILSLSQQGIASERILSLLDTIQECTLAATAGQHRDLLAEQRSAQELTREECIEIAAGKAGAIMGLACRLGALCAGATDALCEQFSEVGELLGISHQLDNDAHDLYYLLQSDTSAVTPNEALNVKTDLVRRKKTLPVVLAAKREDTLQGRSSSPDEERKEYLRALDEGIIATWGICLLYRERARDRLREIESLNRPIAPALRLLLGVE
jgi:geranylgeranyl diphosphate synthase type I